MLLETLLGGITGLLGTGITSFLNYKTQKLTFNHKEKMVDLETKAMIKEAEANIQIEKARIEGEVELADAKAYMESIKHGNKQMFTDKWVEKLFSIEGKMKWIAIPVGVIVAFMFGILDFIRGFMRPGLTMYLVGCTTWVTMMAWKIMEMKGIEVLSGAAAATLFGDVVSMILYLTVSCVTWWFGDRRMAKFLMRLNDGNYKGNQEAPF